MPEWVVYKQNNNRGNLATCPGSSSKMYKKKWQKWLLTYNEEKEKKPQNPNTSERYTREPGEMRKQRANQGFSELQRNRTWNDCVEGKKKKWRQTEHISVVQESRSHRSEQNGCTKRTWGLRPDALLLILRGGRRAQSSVGTKKSWLVLKTETQARCSRRERSLGSRPPTPRADLSSLCPRTSNLPTSLTRSCLLGKRPSWRLFFILPQPFPIPVCLPLLPGIQSWYLLAKPVSKEGCDPHPTCVLSCSVASDSVRPHGLQPARLLCPWGFPGKNTGVGCHALLQGIFLTQGSNPNLLHCRRVLYH